jgi:hypothetical protein
MPNEAIRYDRATIELVESTDEFMRFKVALAQPGVYSYEYPDGRILREAKLPGDLFREETIASAKGIPVTMDHPPVLVTKDNYKEYAKGAISDPRVEENFLWADETVWSSELMEALKANKKVEVSLGLRCKLDRTPGEYNGEAYDVRQFDMIINHVAHVDKARLGSEIKAYLDSADRTINDIAFVTDDKSEEIPAREGDKMDLSWIEGMKKTLSGLRKDSVAEPVKDSDGTIPDPDKKTDTETDKTKSDSDEIANLQSQLTMYKELVGNLKAMLEQALSPVTQDALASKRLKVIESIKAIDPDFKMDGLSEKQMKLHAISKVMPFDNSVRLDSVGNDVIDVRYEACLELARQKALIGNVSQGTNSTRTDASQDIETLKQARLNLRESK